MESKKSRIKSLQKQIADSPGFQIYQQRKAIEISFRIYEGNFEDICAALNHMDNFSVAAKVLARGNEVEREEVELDIRRKLFNYLSAAFALVDHTRKFMKGYSDGSSFADEYQRRIDEEFATSELHKFFQDYRNFVDHYTVPLISHTLHFGRDVDAKYVCGMEKKDLLKWDWWSAPARSWISKQPNNIPIKENLEVHHQKIAQLYEWFLSQILLIHGEDIKETNELIRQHNELLMSPGR